MPRELVAAEGSDASVPVATDDTAPAGVSVAAVVAAEAEEPVSDMFELALTAAFGPVDRWFHQPGWPALPLP